MRHYHVLPLVFALLLPALSAQAAPPKPDFADLPGYLKALNSATDAESLAIRRQIAAGPSDLAHERNAAGKEGILTRVSQLQLPLPSADQNAAPLYIQLNALRKQKPLHFPPYAQGLNGRYAYTPEQIAAVQKEYDARQDIFTLLHQAADKPQCVFVRDLSSFVNYTRYAGLRESARETNTESLLLAYQHRYLEANAAQERGFRIADQSASNSGFVGFLVASAIDAITLSGLQAILEKAGPDAALDSHAEQAVLSRASEPNTFSLRKALSGEAAIVDAEFSLLHHAKPAEIVQSFQDGSPFVGNHKASPSVRFTPGEQKEWNALIDAAQVDYLHQIRRLTAASGLPSAERRATFREVDTRVGANQTSPIEVLSDLLNPVKLAFAVNLLDRLADQVTSRRLVTAAGAAVLAAKAQTGAYPDMLPSQYADPFTGNPLGYRLEGTNGFIVYSAGPTGTFDGGKAGQKVPPQESVFRYPAVPLPLSPDMLK